MHNHQLAYRHAHTNFAFTDTYTPAIVLLLEQMLSLSNWLSKNKRAALDAPLLRCPFCQQGNSLLYQHTYRSLQHGRPPWSLEKASDWLRRTVFIVRTEFHFRMILKHNMKTTCGLPGALRPAEVSWTQLANSALRWSILQGLVEVAAFSLGEFVKLCAIKTPLFPTRVQHAIPSSAAWQRFDGR